MGIETYRGVAFPWLCDQQGHLTTSQYLMMFDVASYHLLDRLTRGAAEPETLSWADVRHEIDYLAEVSVGGLVLIESELVRLGGKSITHRHLMTCPDRTTAYARLTATTVRFDKQARTGVPLSDSIRTRGEALLAGAA